MSDTTKIRFGGLFTSFLVTLFLAVFVYGRGLLNAVVNDGTTSLTTWAVGFAVLSFLAGMPLAAAICFIKREKAGVTLSKVFVIGQVAVWALGVYVIPPLYPILGIAGLYAIGVLLYLRFSERVKVVLQ